ncbi:hypothetical protein [Helicobacter bizzozeronii]|uniref:hypothetical protein n=1 Tax=Helicobacter bizzozeronii TaxID=56877 RepID=UPI000CF0A638|nr:hypothetical protein [Helicobacter bizzozeronii]
MNTTTITITIIMVAHTTITTTIMANTITTTMMEITTTTKVKVHQPRVSRGVLSAIPHTTIFSLVS